MKSLFTIFPILFCLVAESATVTFNLTNSLGVPDTNAIKVFPLASSANADGSWNTVSLPFLIRPNTNGFATTNLSGGNYLLTNSFIVSQYHGPGNFGTSQGVIIAVPNSNGSYPFGLLANSGYNVFNYNGIGGGSGTNTLGVGAGTNITIQTNSGSVTLNVPTQRFLTNGFIDGITASNTFYPLVSNPSNYVQNAILILASNALVSLAQAQSTAATNGMRIDSGLFAFVPTNGYATTGYVQNQTNAIGQQSGLMAFQPTNQWATSGALALATNGFVGPGITNGLETISHTMATYYPTSNPSAFVTAAVINGLATTNFVQTATNGLDSFSGRTNQVGNATNNIGLGAGVFAFVPTNGYATVGYVQNQTNTIGQGSGLFAYQLTNSRPTFNDVTNIAGQFSGVASNAIANINGIGTNVVLTNSISITVTNLKLTGIENANGFPITNLNQIYGSQLNSNFMVSVGGFTNISIFAFVNSADTNTEINLGTKNYITNIYNGAILSGEYNSLSSPFFGFYTFPNGGYGGVICGGYFNTNNAENFGFIGMGNANNIAYDPYTFIGNGNNNFVGDDYGTILNGYNNTVIINSLGGSEGGQMILNGGNNFVQSPFSWIGDGLGGSIVYNINSPVPVPDFNTIINGSFNAITNSRNVTVMSGGTNIVFGANGVFIAGSFITASNNGVAILNDGTRISNFTNRQMILKFANGVSINTNYSGTNALEVFGNIDASGLSISGVPISQTAGSVAAGVNATVATNGTIYTVNATNQTFLTNGLASIQLVTNLWTVSSNAVVTTSNALTTRITWGITTSITAASRPASVYYFSTNNQIVYSLITTN